MSKGKVSTVVTDLISGFLDENNYELVEVEFVKEGTERYLRILIDKEGGVSLDDCQLVSQFISRELDKKDPIEENYFLEVSSPGIERVLRKDEDYEKYKGKKVDVKLYQTINGQKNFTGKLLGLDKNIVKIISDITGDEISISREKIALIKLIVEF